MKARKFCRTNKLHVADRFTAASMQPYTAVNGDIRLQCDSPAELILEHAARVHLSSSFYTFFVGYHRAGLSGIRAEHASFSLEPRSCGTPALT